MRNYRKVIDIGKGIKFDPISSWKAKLTFHRKIWEQIPFLAF